MISTEAILIILGLFGTLFGGWRTIVTNRSIAKKETEIADARAKVAESDVKVKAAEAQLIETRSQAEQQVTITRIADRQQTLLEKMEQTITARDNEFLTRWGTVSMLFNDIKAGEANVYNALNQLAGVQSQIVGMMEHLPEIVRTANNEAAKEIAGTVGMEIAAQMAREFAVKRLEHDLPPFPDPEDLRWQKLFIIPIVPDATIHKDIRFSDAVKLKLPCARINEAGEMVWLIEEPAINGFYIRKINDDCWGYLPKHMVRIGELKPAAT